METITLRYTRTDMDRMGPWEPVNSSWRTTASHSMVVHDLLHHQPGDSGSFEEEILSLGAQWYIEDQAADSAPQHITPRMRDNYFRIVEDVALNALESSQERPFLLSAGTPQGLTVLEQAFFMELALTARLTVEAAPGARAEQARNDVSVPAFFDRFLAAMDRGIALARARFPAQFSIRRSARALLHELADLTDEDVPVGHVIEVAVAGHDVSLSYTDADEAFLIETQAKKAFAMVWCDLTEGYPSRHVTLHATREAYALFEARHFENQSEELPEDEKRIPEGDAVHLRQVYVLDAELIEALSQDDGVRVSLERVDEAFRSPRGVVTL